MSGSLFYRWQQRLPLSALVRGVHHLCLSSASRQQRDGAELRAVCKSPSGVAVTDRAHTDAYMFKSAAVSTEMISAALEKMLCAYLTGKRHSWAFSHTRGDGQTICCCSLYDGFIWWLSGDRLTHTDHFKTLQSHSFFLLSTHNPHNISPAEHNSPGPQDQRKGNCYGLDLQ